MLGRWCLLWITEFSVLVFLWKGNVCIWGFKMILLVLWPQSGKMDITERNLEIHICCKAEIHRFPIMRFLRFTGRGFVLANCSPFPLLILMLRKRRYPLQNHIRELTAGM